MENSVYNTGEMNKLRENYWDLLRDTMGIDYSVHTYRANLDERKRVAFDCAQLYAMSCFIEGNAWLLKEKRFPEIVKIVNRDLLHDLLGEVLETFVAQKVPSSKQSKIILKPLLDFNGRTFKETFNEYKNDNRLDSLGKYVKDMLGVKKEEPSSKKEESSSQRMSLGENKSKEDFKPDFSGTVEQNKEHFDTNYWQHHPHDYKAYCDLGEDKRVMLGMNKPVVEYFNKRRALARKVYEQYTETKERSEDAPRLRDQKVAYNFLLAIDKLKGNLNEEQKLYIGYHEGLFYDNYHGRDLSRAFDTELSIVRRRTLVCYRELDDWQVDKIRLYGEEYNKAIETLEKNLTDREIDKDTGDLTHVGVRKYLEPYNQFLEKFYYLFNCGGVIGSYIGCDCLDDLSHYYNVLINSPRVHISYMEEFTSYMKDYIKQYGRKVVLD